LFHKEERRLVCPQNMVVLFDRPVEKSFTPLGTYGTGFELTKAFFLVSRGKELLSAIEKSLDSLN
jgi:hypothetical protein